MKIKDYIQYFDECYNEELAYNFDNPGPTIISDNTECTGIVICLDITNKCIDFAKSKNCNFIVSHHPLIFNPIKSINKNTMVGKCINKIIKNDITVMGIHTNFDVHYNGMNKAVNEQLSKYLEFSFIDYVEKVDYHKDKKHKYGCGSYLKLKKATSLDNLSSFFSKAFNINCIRVYNSIDNNSIKNIAVCPGSGYSFIHYIINSKVDCLISGDLNHHLILDLNEMGINYIDATHSGLENVFVPFMYNKIKKQFRKERIFMYEG